MSSDFAATILDPRLHTWISVLLITGIALFLIPGGIGRRSTGLDHADTDGHLCSSATGQPGN